MAGMEQNDVGRRILKEQPIVDETVAKQAMELLHQHNNDLSQTNINKHNPINTGRDKESVTFGAAYARFLSTHEYDPNDRSAVRFISDPKLTYMIIGMF